MELTTIERPNLHPNRPLKVGYFLPETEGRRGTEIVRWTELREMAQRAEAVGFDSLWVVDRLLFPVGEVYSEELNEALGVTTNSEESTGGWEAWSLMAALAAVTTRVELGQYVTNSLFRNPGLLAKIADTVDEISGGRLILSIGAGDGGGDATRFGYPDDHRVGRFEEAIQIVHGLLRTGWADFDGTYYRVREAELRPRGPRPEGPPILIGSQLGPRMLRLAAQYADLWNTFHAFRPEEVAAALTPLDVALAAVGRDPATLERVLSVMVDLPGPRQHPPSTAYGYERATLAAESGTLLSGGPAAIAEGLRAYADAEIGHIVVWLDPDTVEGIEAFAPVLALLDGE
jgi:alkanesulfonate monooxygenase SsuD/methylene tetrahydromethanopterin reductase-like flavin-dependent oxidoreductase (luciferase family)